MDLINATPLACEARVVTDPEGSTARLGVVSAKATFSVDSNGRVMLETQAPHSLFAEDQETPLGVLPNDLPVRRGSEFEVMMLGAAYAPGGAPVEELVVALSVGKHSRTIRVVGDRRWVDTSGRMALSTPTPFVRMPLVWERAFGGSAEVWLDERSTTVIRHEINPRGRGFDPSTSIDAFTKLVYTSAGFPRTVYERLAPNLEAPDAPLATASDDPEPVCFAPTPMDIAVQSRAMGTAFMNQSGDATYPSEVGVRRAVPDWVLSRAPLGQLVEATHCRPEGDFRFQIPTATPIMDYIVGERTGTRALTPQRIVLLPEESSFYLVYRHYFMLRTDTETERSVRIRFE